MVCLRKEKGGGANVMLLTDLLSDWEMSCNRRSRHLIGRILQGDCVWKQSRGDALLPSWKKEVIMQEGSSHAYKHVYEDQLNV